MRFALLNSPRHQMFALLCALLNMPVMSGESSGNKNDTDGDNSEPPKISEVQHSYEGSLALVPYVDNPATGVLARFEAKKASWTVGNITIRVTQDWQSGGVAAVVWDAAVVLAEFLSEHPDWVKGRNILELGAGTGFAGIAASKLGAAQVILTDRRDALGILRKNVELNKLPIGSNCDTEVEKSTVSGKVPDRNSDLKRTKECDEQWKKTHVLIEELEWGTTTNFRPQLILGADIVYIEETFNLLIETLRQLTNQKQSEKDGYTAVKNNDRNSVKGSGDSPYEVQQTIESSDHYGTCPKYNRYDLNNYAEGGKDTLCTIDKVVTHDEETVNKNTDQLSNFGVLLSCRLRYDREERFLSMLAEYFAVKEILYDSERDIHIYHAVV